MRYAILFLLAVLFGCAEDDDQGWPTYECGPMTCDGCCDSYGGCRREETNTTCGTGGRSCVNCTLAWGVSYVCAVPEGYEDNVYWCVPRP